MNCEIDFVKIPKNRIYSHVGYLAIMVFVSFMSIDDTVGGARHSLIDLLLEIHYV